MKSKTGILCLFLIVLTLSRVTIGAPPSTVPKAGPGSCPPPLPVSECTATCEASGSCPAPQLCCPTDCGGSVCTDPVTMRKNTHLVKPGICPAEPKGPWVCSSTCTGDSDCRRRAKCCANRCGALACMKPDIQT